MTNLLTITAAPDAPVVCDMTAAEDSIADRLAEFRRLFAHALLGRETTETSSTFRLAARPGVREWVLDLVRREAACCPFLSYQVDAIGEELVWTTSGGLGDSAMNVLDPFPSGAEGVGDSSGSIAQQLEERSGIPVRIPPVQH